MRNPRSAFMGLGTSGLGRTISTLRTQKSRKRCVPYNAPVAHVETLEDDLLSCNAIDITLK